MLIKYQWRVIPSKVPAVIKNCPKCGCSSEFESSGNFRVNANQSHIDVWLIYQCRKCKTTWNMEIMSRVNPKTIDRELYSKFLCNDKELADRYAFDPVIHKQNRVDLSYDNLAYEIIGDEIKKESLSEDVQIELMSEHCLDIRLDKLLSRKLSISREQVKKLCSLGKIYSDNISDLTKAKVKDGILLLTVRP